MGAITKVLMALVPVAAVALLAALAWPAVKPVAEDGFQDLRVERREIPDGKNFRVVLERAGGLMPESASCSVLMRLAQRSSYGQWDPGAVRTALVQTAEARACIRAGLAGCEGYAGRGTRAEFRITPGAEVSVLPCAWRLSFDEALSRGDACAARGQLLDGLRILSLLLDAPSDFYDAGILFTWCGQVLGACERLVHDPGCQAEWLAELSERMPRQGAVRQAGVSLLRGQFWQGVNAVETGAAIEAVLPLCGRTPTATELRMRRVDVPATCRLLAGDFRTHLGVLETNRTDAAYFDYYGGDSFLTLAAGALKIWLEPNAGGRNISSHYALFARLNVGRLKALENGVGCLRAVVAAERFRRAEGSAPETLDALVPGYLEEVPRDTFGGGPIRYACERGLVWSVGQNGVDDGGSTRTDKGEAGRFRASRSKDALDMVYPVSSKAVEEAANQARMWLEKKKR